MDRAAAQQLTIFLAGWLLAACCMIRITIWVFQAVQARRPQRPAASKQQCIHLDHRLLGVAPGTVGILLLPRKGYRVGLRIVLFVARFLLHG